MRFFPTSFLTLFQCYKDSNLNEPQTTPQSVCCMFREGTFRKASWQPLCTPQLCKLNYFPLGYCGITYVRDVIKPKEVDRLVLPGIMKQYRNSLWVRTKFPSLISREVNIDDGKRPLSAESRSTFACLECALYRYCL